ncbi:hypothetical protein PGT21_008497 [Puccinia graminis f. sp. tritici]|uniref:Uncharacterized protein n=1 Tax=Puccinia graminis f. sp. tritici TaxID=56615 RepID=A0A5B0NV06_PUCGR|nr:hypothetical protein PGT21_008497 [Puccinia graminis f. sp. tritici]KAA1093710.1 hypothetical protein PGTUg99_022278 [Puccinia graminis f. sp. tritici]
MTVGSLTANQSRLRNTGNLTGQSNRRHESQRSDERINPDRQRHGGMTIEQRRPGGMTGRASHLVIPTVRGASNPRQGDRALGQSFDVGWIARSSLNCSGGNAIGFKSPRPVEGQIIVATDNDATHVAGLSVSDPLDTGCLTERITMSPKELEFLGEALLWIPSPRTYSLITSNYKYVMGIFCSSC